MFPSSPALRRYLSKAGPVSFVLIAGLVAFAAYACVYAFRKPFTAASFSGLEVWGIQYKIALVIAQVAGYALSKFFGIRFISTLGAEHRARTLLTLIGFAALTLTGFACSSLHWGVFWMFLNGIPLGMGWGVVFGYLEGRRFTEALAALLCINFIVSSGFVKSLGKWLILEHHISEHWMPIFTGMMFLPFLLICVWLLEHLPAPTEADQALRNKREAMTAAQRKALFGRYAPGLLLLTAIYLLLTVVRDVRDNFAVEIWAELGLGSSAAILTTAELPIAVLILLGIGALILVKNNFKALWINHAIFIGGALLLLTSTYCFQIGWITPFWWMMLSGTGIFIAYILFNGVIFDRLLAAFKEQGNVGFLMYFADAIGYLGSVAVLLWRNFGYMELSWVQFFSTLCLYSAVMIIVLSIISWRYFRRKSPQTQRRRLSPRQLP